MLNKKNKMFYRKIPTYLFEYARLPPSPDATTTTTTTTSTINHPQAFVKAIKRFDELDDLILKLFPSPKLLHTTSSSFTESSRKDFQHRLHSHFRNEQRLIIESFFNNCEATHQGITNFSDEDNLNLNNSLLEAAHPSKTDFLTNSEKVKRVCELGAGTGRLSRILASVYADHYYNNNTEYSSSSSYDEQRREFEFWEPSERLLKESCIQNVNQAFEEAVLKYRHHHHQSNSSSFLSRNKFKKKGRFYNSLTIGCHDGQSLVDAEKEKLKSSSSSSSSSLLIMSGVGQYLSDKTLVELLNLFPRVLIQEDVAMNFQVVPKKKTSSSSSSSSNNASGEEASNVLGDQQQHDDDKEVEEIFCIFHQRDGSLVRSEKYFEEMIFGGGDQEDHYWATTSKKVKKRIVGTSTHENHGCVTKTWALENY